MTILSYSLRLSGIVVDRTIVQPLSENMLRELFSVVVGYRPFPGRDVVRFADTFSLYHVGLYNDHRVDVEAIFLAATARWKTLLGNLTLTNTIRPRFDHALRPFDDYVNDRTPISVCGRQCCGPQIKQEFVRPIWPYDMRPSARAEKYIRDAGP